jgi:uncharacterized protein YqhQ
MNGKKRGFIHGEAFIYGVMMRNRKTMAITFRNEDGNIVEKVEERPSLLDKNRFFNLPIIRGIIRFLEGSINQFRAKHLTINLRNKKKRHGQDFLNKKNRTMINDILPYISVLSILFVGVILYFVVPTIMAFLLKKFIGHNLVLNLIETIIRLLIFLCIFYVMSHTANAKKSALYHGAEHKAIHCYLNGEDPTIEKAKRYPVYNPSCGTSFLLLLIIVSIPFFALLNYENLIQRIIIMLLLLPLLVGISFDLAIWSGKSKSKLAKIISFPGEYLQRFNTMEPDDKHLEIALISLKNLLACENVKSRAR